MTDREEDAHEFDVNAILADRRLHEAALGSYRVVLVDKDGTYHYWITKTAAEAVRVADEFSSDMHEGDLLCILVDQPDGPPRERWYGPPIKRQELRHELLTVLAALRDRRGH